jgi:hypothetical protein
VHVATTARSITGQRLAGSASASFKVVRPTVRKIKWSSPSALRTSPWHFAELNMLALMNCTRTGSWVTASGSCSSVTHHVLPAQAALAFDEGIASKVSRPYAKYLADRNALSHYLRGSPHSRLAAAGYGSGTWGENIASPANPRASGTIGVELFFQNEYRCQHSRCEFTHYANVMNGRFHRVGIGVWVTNGHTRVVIDFYS